MPGTGFTDQSVSAAPPLPKQLGGLQLLLDGQPLPLQTVAPAQACFQVPWDTPTGKHTLEAVADSDARFESGTSGTLEIDWTRFVDFATLGSGFPLSVALTPLPLVAHADFSGLVTPSSPAVPGEVLNFYVTGLGPVASAVPTGEASPANPPAVAITQPECRLTDLPDSSTTPMDVLFAGLAPGFVGYYQLSVRLPAEVPASGGQALIRCSAGADYAGESTWVPVSSPVP